jgi:hypothetical protein
MDVDRALDATVGVGGWVRYADDIFVRANNRRSITKVVELVVSKLAFDDLACRIRLEPYHGFEALGSRWFLGGFENIARHTRARVLRLASRCSRMYSQGFYSQNRLRSTFSSLRGLAVYDRRWTKRVGEAILEAI